MASASPVVVVGAGVVGLSTALYLRRSGRDVVVIDPLPPPGGASFGNAGMISPDTSVPIALPGMLRKVPSWLMDPLGPLSVRPSYFPRALPWLLKWIAASRLPRVLEISDAMRALHKETFVCWKELLGPQLFGDLIRPAGQVHVWETDSESEGAALERRLRERQGIATQALGADDLRQMFPGLSRSVRRGVLMPGNGYTLNPQRLVQTLHRLFLEAGGRLLAENVMKILPRPQGGGYDLMTNSGFHAAEQIVVAAGARSVRLLEPLGVRLPLETERGYHVMLPAPNVSLTTTISNKSRSFGVTPMEHGLRVAGTVEIAGLEAPPNERRNQALLVHIRSMFPDVNTEGHRFWMGFRPSTPDSLPILGEVAGRPGLFLAVGHGHFGMTGGPPSGRLVSRLVNQEPPGLDTSLYAPQRF
ncbi:MAG TPA: FAD-dependent oxidoreductase [Reyranella sp.]|nr:FAD-dependent oxidoreductase [Reyranella sp.]